MGHGACPSCTAHGCDCTAAANLACPRCAERNGTCGAHPRELLCRDTSVLVNWRLCGEFCAWRHCREVPLQCCVCQDEYANDPGCCRTEGWLWCCTFGAFPYGVQRHRGPPIDRCARCGARPPIANMPCLKCGAAPPLPPVRSMDAVDASAVTTPMAVDAATRLSPHAWSGAVSAGGKPPLPHGDGAESPAASMRTTPDGARSPAVGLGATWGRRSSLDLTQFTASPLPPAPGATPPATTATTPQPGERQRVVCLLDVPEVHREFASLPPSRPGSRVGSRATSRCPSPQPPPAPRTFHVDGDDDTDRLL